MLRSFPRIWSPVWHERRAAEAEQVRQGPTRRAEAALEGSAGRKSATTRRKRGGYAAILWLAGGAERMNS